MDPFEEKFMFFFCFFFVFKNLPIFSNTDIYINFSKTAKKSQAPC